MTEPIPQNHGGGSLGDRYGGQSPNNGKDGWTELALRKLMR